MAFPERYRARHRGKYGAKTPFARTDDGPAHRAGPYESQREPRAAFAAMVNVLDDQVGEIVAEVRDLGIAEQTLIVISSNNSQHRRPAPPQFFSARGTGCAGSSAISMRAATVCP